MAFSFKTKSYQVQVTLIAQFDDVEAAKQAQQAVREHASKNQYGKIECKLHGTKSTATSFEIDLDTGEQRPIATEASNATQYELLVVIYGQQALDDFKARFGMSGSKAGSPRIVYSDDIKAKALQLKQAGKTLKQICSQLGVSSPTTLQNWFKQAA
jgi:hypothetical protein